MCGLVGCVGKITKKEEDAFITLLQLDTIRGPHSTGVAFVHHKEETIIAKALGTPWDLFETEDFKKGFARVSAVLMGHNRFATKGEINSKNAHPFSHEHIIGAHNGTLRRQSLLDDYRDFEVDSDNIFFDMSKNGHKATIKRLDGAFALSWINEEDNTLNLCRNSERPLFYVFTEENKTVFWASERWMLDIAASRAAIKLHEIKCLEVGEHVSFKIPDVAPSQFNQYKDYFSEKLDLHVEWQSSFNYTRYDHKSHKFEKKEESLGKGGSTIKNLPSDTTFPQLLAKYREQGEIEFFVAEEVRKPAQGNKAPYIKCYTQDKYGVEVRVFQELGSPIWKRLAASGDWFRAKIKATSQFSETGGYITIDCRTLVDVEWKDLSADGKAIFNQAQTPEYKGFKGIVLTQQQLLEATNKGCCVCNDISSLNDHKSIVWLNNEDYLCKKCSKDTEFAQSILEEYKNQNVIH